MAERSFDVYTVLQYAHPGRFPLLYKIAESTRGDKRTSAYPLYRNNSDRVLTKASECGRDGDLSRVALYSGSAAFASRKRVRPPLKKIQLSLSPSLNTELLWRDYIARLTLRARLLVETETQSIAIRTCGCAKKDHANVSSFLEYSLLRIFSSTIT